MLLALVLAFAAIVWVWSQQREIERLTRRLDRYNKALFDMGDEVRTLREESAASMAELRVALNRQAGSLRFAPEMSLREAQLIHPQVHEVLAGFHLGGCESCAVEPDDTLAEICAAKGVPMEQLLGTLNLLVAGDGSYAANGGASRAAPMLQHVKLPNVSLEIE
jgi:hypothetical protein